MKLNRLLPWICALGLGAGLASAFVSGRAKDAELAKLRAESAQAQQLQADLAAAQAQAQRQAGQIADLEKDNQELLRLRSEVGRLRKENERISKQAAAAQSAVEQAQAQAAQSAKSSAAQLLQAQSENQKLRVDSVQQGLQIIQQHACIDNLRQLVGAKTQWALEEHKTAEATPTMEDIAPYLKGNAVPICPAGGAYTLNNLSTAPTCSYPAHVLQ